MTGGGAAERSERSERSLPIVGGPGDAARLIGQAAALSVHLEARPGGRLWADWLDLLPPDLRASLAAHRPAVLRLLLADQHDMQDASPPAVVPALPVDALAALLPAIPLDWCEGVARLAAMPAPDSITPVRWAVLAATSARLVRDQGAALHGARWDALDLFGLHPTAPMRYPPGWSLAWLLGDQGAVLDIAPDAVGLRRQPDGARLVFLRRVGPPSGGIVPAWVL